MAILPHSNTNLFNNVIDEFKKRFFLMNNLNLNSEHGLHNYLHLMENMDSTLHSFIITYITKWLEALDLKFKNDINRTKTYHVKSFHSRTIMTIFGLITYSRTFYLNKHTGKYYCHVDSYLGLKKYDHFDPYVKSLVVEAAANDSLAGAARHVSAMIGIRVSMEGNPLWISRQAAKSFVLNSVLSRQPIKRKKTTPKTLFIMLDEKFIHTQNNNKKDIMVKHAVVFEGIKLVTNHKSRYELIGKYCLSSFGNNFDEDILTYINKAYITKDIEHIYILGDGAKWIKTYSRNFKLETNTQSFVLDKFHFKKALHLTSLNKDLDEIMLKYILMDQKEFFKTICDSLALKYNHRSEKIIDKKNYILNNWDAIQLSYHENLKCSMEGHISHNLAARFSSRPNGHAIKSLNKFIPLRMSFVNGDNIRKLYLNNYNSNKIKVMGEKRLNFSIFDIVNEKSPPKIGKSVSIELSRKIH